MLYFKEARDDNITSEAFKTGEDSKWLYIQRRRRYEFVKAHYPDLAPVAEPDMASTTMLYGVYCLNVSHDMRAYEDAKRWARAERLEMSGYPFTSRAALWAYLHCKPLFRIAARIWQKRRNERVLQRR